MELTQEYLKSILEYNPDTGIFVWKTQNAYHNIGDTAGFFDKDGYIIISINSKLYRAHRLAWFYVTGKWPINQIDHEDLNKSNNTWTNLREATNSQNKMNMTLQKNNTSGYKGISWSKFANKWMVYIKLNNVRTHLGYFSDLEDAIAVRLNAANIYHDSSFRRSA